MTLSTDLARSGARLGADHLAHARIHLKRLEELPEPARPRTPEEAYACQDLLVERLLAHYGGSVIGYKIACTNRMAQELLHVDAPFHGKMLSATTQASPGRIARGDFFMCVMEAEFAFRMGRDLASPGRPFAIEEVSDAVEGLLPGLEIVDSRFNSWTTVGAPSLIADNACHGAWIKGKLLEDWRRLDLASQEVRLLVNGAVREKGSGSAVLGHPLNALVWLANALAARGQRLQAGDYVTTGVTTNIYLAERGDVVRAEFGPVGSAEVVFE